MDDIETVLVEAANKIGDLLREVESQVQKIRRLDPALAEGLRDLVRTSQGCADGLRSIAGQWHDVRPR
ncbi:MAG TPA: hypothetical protein VMK16_08485 [Acidimicrobiales bacterium]|nr:hypothetical protein [Acidimicrobiales bacterium]